ncbi:hypothetical protein [Agromyces aureus]|nr:hypothetical protein [Agromyces aureus]
MIKPIEIVIVAVAILGFVANAVLFGAAPFTYLFWVVAILALVPGCVRWVRARRAASRE